MHFVVLVAFAMVFMPVGKPPWPVLEHPLAVVAIVLGQLAAVALWAGWATRRVVRLLDEQVSRPGMAQRQHARNGALLSAAVLAGLAASMWGTAWPQVVRNDWNLGAVYGLDELVILLPFFTAILIAWAMMYPADRAIRQLMMEADLWEGRPARPAWDLKRYLVFLVRHQLLLVALPMLLIVIANDVVQDHITVLRRATRLFWIDQVIVVLVAGVILFFAPLMLRFIWSTSTLPGGALRDRLRAVSQRLGLKYREILIWHSEGMVANAAVMGMLPMVRYVLLSDALLEKMDDEKIEAVFGHEAGHIRHLHIPFYLLFALLSMLVVGGACELAWRVFHVDPSYISIGALFLIAATWGVAFGWVSRRFERQADLFGARLVTPSADGCTLPCRVHHEADGVVPVAKALCATGAHTFAGALHRIAALNGIPEEARSWRHSSIASRMRFLEELAADPAAVGRFSRTILVIRVVLVIGTVIGLAVAVWLYSDQM